MAEKQKPATTAEANEDLVVNVVGCGRCGGLHDKLGFKRLKRPVSLPQADVTHWTMCPTTGEPIMLMIGQG